MLLKRNVVDVPLTSESMRRKRLSRRLLANLKNQGTIRSRRSLAGSMLAY